MIDTTTHVPVLLAETIDALNVQPGSWYVDCTFGRGGHTFEILKRGGQVIALDVDHNAIAYGQERFAKEIAENKLFLLRQNFSELDHALYAFTKDHPHVITNLCGILFDFGVSSPQIDKDERGFSFRSDAELDMRMDDRLGVKAKDLLALLSEKQLADAFFQLGGETDARRIARQIVLERKKAAITHTQELAFLIERAKRGRIIRGHLHPATKVFQALRMLVNSELESIEAALPQALLWVSEKGRVVTISFHEGEDRICKQTFRTWEETEKGTIISKNVIVASEEEVARNQRARSAKLRVFEKK